MNDQTFELLISQINRLEQKVDELIRWKYYFTGVAAVVGSIFGGGVSLIIAWVSSLK